MAQYQVKKLRTALSMTLVTDSYTLEFWAMLYPYVPTQISFGSYDVILDNIARINLSYDAVAGKLNFLCYPAYSYAAPSTYSEFSGTTFSANIWNFFRCSADRTAQKYAWAMNNADVSTTYDFTNFPATITDADFYMGDSSPNDHGHLFLSQVRIWNCFNSCFPDIYYYRR